MGKVINKKVIDDKKQEKEKDLIIAELQVKNALIEKALDDLILGGIK